MALPCGIPSKPNSSSADGGGLGAGLPVCWLSVVWGGKWQEVHAWLGLILGLGNDSNGCNDMDRIRFHVMEHPSLPSCCIIWLVFSRCCLQLLCILPKWSKLHLSLSLSLAGEHVLFTVDLPMTLASAKGIHYKTVSPSHPLPKAGSGQGQ